ncbi:CHRD domain-containing protein [Actinosynnema sp. NPDC020468]|uniref:CHRD domain-containing protein n=1 Tax=Actinosynnema sp. NPDC020468 TaxID=3154488 RepID=UPI00340440B4
MKHLLRLVVPIAATAFALAGTAPAASADTAGTSGVDLGSDVGIGLTLNLDLDVVLNLGGSVTRTATLRGSSEVPGPGDPDGRGYAVLRISRDRVCASLAVDGVVTPTAAHVHRGATGVAGPVVATLATPADGDAAGCVAVDRDVTRGLVREPGQFYVNVHNGPFPNGALRGQLRR